MKNVGVEWGNDNVKMWGKNETAIASQLIRCGMAIGANVSEAQQAESRSDFIHKMKIAAKEASESLKNS